jgi:hypothetical protein
MHAAHPGGAIGPPGSPADSPRHATGHVLPEAQANWDAVLGHLSAAAPEVVIHLGDLSLDGAHNPGDLHYGRQQLDRLPRDIPDPLPPLT